MIWIMSAYVLIIILLALVILAGCFRLLREMKQDKS